MDRRKGLAAPVCMTKSFFSAVGNRSSCCVTALFTVAGVTEAHVGRGFRGLRATKTISRVIHKVACCGLSSSLPAWRTT